MNREDHDATLASDGILLPAARLKECSDLGVSLSREEEYDGGDGEGLGEAVFRVHHHVRIETRGADAIMSCGGELWRRPRHPSQEPLGQRRESKRI